MPRQTPLFDRHVAAGARMVDFAGWQMPQQYSSVRDEQAAVRGASAVFDVSHMGRARVSGEGATEALQRIVTNDLAAVEPGRAQYNLMCLEDGGVIDDLVLYRDHDGWAVVFNAGNREKDLAWFRDHLGGGVEFEDQSDATALLAVQGPQAAPVVTRLAGAEVDVLPYFGHGTFAIAGVPGCRIARTGYTGEDGFELFLPADRAAGVWDAVLEAGASPAGLAARDVCRLEAGLRLYGNDMDETVNPYEAGLGWTVKLGKGEFIGRSALESVRSSGPARTLIGLRGAGRTIPRHGATVLAGGRQVGEVTSGTWSFLLEAGIGMALVDAGSVTEGAEVAVGGRGEPAPAQVAALPFYKGTAGKRRVDAARQS